MNTPKLPPLPEWSKMDNLGGLVPSEIRQELRAYALAAIAAQGVPDVQAIRAALRSALAWGRVYGEVIPAHQWDDMREAQIEQAMKSLLASAPPPVQQAESAKRPSADWYKAKIMETLDDDFNIGPAPQAARCELCQYQHGHQIGCANNPVDIALKAQAQHLASSDPPTPQAKSDCSDCSNADSWGLPDKPLCATCTAGSAWSPLNKSSVNPNKTAPQAEDNDAAESINETNAVLASRYFELLKVVEQYEKNGVTCQTFRHFISEPCAECNSPGRCGKQVPVEQQKPPQPPGFTAGRSDNTADLMAAPQTEPAPAGSGGWEAHAKALEHELVYWKQRAQTMHEHQKGECWYWQGDGDDHPESMVNSLPVVIRADALRALMAPQAKPQPLSDEQWLAYILKHADPEVLHIAAFIGETIQSQGKWCLFKAANKLRKLVEQAYGIKE